MISGTIRSNLDITGERTDAELWAALELASLKAAVQQMEVRYSTVLARIFKCSSESEWNPSQSPKTLSCMPTLTHPLPPTHVHPPASTHHSPTYLTVPRVSSTTS